MKQPDKIGKYEIQGILGRGGMGAVYKGFDPAISRAVAIKTIGKSSLDASELQHLLARFRHEAQVVGRLAHPGIVQIYDYGEDDELAYIVMELVNGKSLHEHLLQHASYDLREVGEIIGALLDGLGHAHAAGVVHRDVKPSNIMINKDGGIKISDFGIAHTESSELTQHGDVLGTPHYMSPEQFLGLPGRRACRPVRGRRDRLRPPDRHQTVRRQHRHRDAAGAEPAPRRSVQPESKTFAHR